jgi:hypothetical protein
MYFIHWKGDMSDVIWLELYEDALSCSKKFLDDYYSQSPSMERDMLYGKIARKEQKRKSSKECVCTVIFIFIGFCNFKFILVH